MYLARRGEATNIQLISKARVPIVKFEETKSGVQFDVSFDVANGPRRRAEIEEKYETVSSFEAFNDCFEMFFIAKRVE